MVSKGFIQVQKIPDYQRNPKTMILFDRMSQTLYVQIVPERK